MSYTFEEILEYSGFDYLPFEKPVDDVYEMDIPYANNVTMSFISSFIADLTNNGFNVFSEILDGKVHIKAIINALPSQSASKKKIRQHQISTSAAYYMVKKWVDKLNRQLQELQVEVEKVEGDYNYGVKRQVNKRYGKGSTFYIINPEINQQELLDIVDFLDTYSVPLRAEWFRRSNVFPVSDSEFLLEKGYSPNETYLAFPIDKDEINYDFYSNLGKGKSLIWKDKEEENKEAV